MTKKINVVIIDYPNALQSAVHGLQELFLMANDIISAHQLAMVFHVEILMPTQELPDANGQDIVILPPAMSGNYFSEPPQHLLNYLHIAHQQGSTLCCACAGSFILASSGLLDGRQATTHWQLAQQFNQQFPTVELNIESLLINDGDIISAGGLMSWVDLGLEIVAQFTKPHIMRALGKYLIVDTGKREQRYYGSFTPKLTHGNPQILQVQHHIQTHYSDTLTITALADIACMSERTFLRQFTSATTIKPTQYIQRVRVQKACELLESSNTSFEQIALSVGYEDANSFRKVFIKVIGLSPTSFKARFV